MLRVIRRSDAEIRRLLDKAAQAAVSDIEGLATSGTGKIIRRGQLSAATQALRKTIRILFRDVGDTVRAGRVDAAEAALLSAFEWEEPYYRAAGMSKPERDRLRAATAVMSERNVELMLRRFTTEQIPLSQQVYRTQQLAQGWVDERVNLGIGRGLTAKELARDVRDSIRPDVSGGVSYAAMRLARTELNNSFHAAAVEATQDKPWINGMQWHLSESHPKPDICNHYADEDKFGIGSGTFPVDKVPEKPHPHCFCFVVPGLQDEDDFVAAFARGDYDDQFGATVTAPAKPKEGREALAAAPLDMNDESLAINGMRGIDSDRDQIIQYKGVAYSPTNNYLRFGSGSFLRSNIEAIDRSINKSRLTEDVFVLRGVKDPRAVFGEHINGDLTGLEWTDDAYLSTTADPRISDGFARRTKSPDGGLVMRMRVPKGAPMLRLSDLAPDDEKIDSTSAEAELLGGRGWTLRIVKDNGKIDGLRNVEVEVISHERSGTNPWDRG
jgi:hypothetical protein